MVERIVKVVFEHISLHEVLSLRALRLQFDHFLDLVFALSQGEACLVGILLHESLLALVCFGFGIPGVEIAVFVVSFLLL